MTRRPPTIRDVARRAGTSRATVSRVLNGYPHVRSQLRNRVLRAVEALRYQPNGVAQSLVRRETRTIGLLVADITNPFYGEAARTVTEVLVSRGYNLMLADSQYLPEVHRQHIRLLQERRVDGIIFGSVLADDPDVEQLVASGYPCIMFHRRLGSGRGNFVVLDNLEAARLVTRHLVELGHRRIGFVAGPANTSTARERFQGFRVAMTGAGLPVEASLVRQGHYRTDFAFRAAQELLALPDPPTAIVATNDVMALAALQAAGDRGIRVPEGVSVVGMDDIAMAAHHRIRLTTVAGYPAEQARLAAASMLEILADPDRFAPRPLQHVLQPTLIVRGTSGPPPSRQSRPLTE